MLRTAAVSAKDIEEEEDDALDPLEREKNALNPFPLLLPLDILEVDGSAILAPRARDPLLLLNADALVAGVLNLFPKPPLLYMSS